MTELTIAFFAHHHVCVCTTPQPMLFAISIYVPTHPSQPPSTRTAARVIFLFRNLDQGRRTGVSKHEEVSFLPAIEKKNRVVGFTRAALHT